MTRNGREGRVLLVGAGPGDPGLITRRGLEALRACDVVVYDRLVAPELVEEAACAERIYVGKVPGGRSADQQLINLLLVTHASAGRVVVRLKGGDPFVFGRGGEEAQALVAAGVDFEVVPGVTSAVAAPAYAGIPVTHRGVSSSFAVLTGHQSTGAGAGRWEELAGGPDTLVLLMGVEGLRRASGRLIAAGRPPEQPAAVIEWATTPRQRTVRGSLASIADVAEAAGIEPPATAVVGEVVALMGTLAWFEGAAVDPPARPEALHAGV